MTRDLIYAVVDDALIFIPKDLADELVGIRAAIDGAHTWGQFRAALPAGRRAGIEERLDDREPCPSDSDGFSKDALPGYVDGDWPEWPQQEMLEWMPAAVKAFGRVEDSAFNGPFLVIDEAKLWEVLAGLQRHGYTCAPAQAVVEYACGY